MEDIATAAPQSWFQAYLPPMAGGAGVAHAIALLASEIEADMGLLGINRLDQLGPAQLVPRSGTNVAQNSVAM